MSRARLPKDRYWVMVELPSEGRVTGASFYDFNMIDLYKYNRKQDGSGEVDYVEFVYAGTLKPRGFSGERAVFVHEQWLKFCELNQNLYAAMPPAEIDESVILIARENISLPELDS